MNAKTKKSLPTKSEFIAQVAELSGLTKNDVKNVLGALEDSIRSQLSKSGSGNFILPGLLKSKVVRKPAVPERQGINPFTKEEQVFKAKPATNAIKLIPLKNLKDMVPKP